ncbi:DNA-binding transcriptional LysR family regulator [Cytobacillus horneckiae]|uniref:LysR family transcriptional regulator n=1 Tax=Cytobacillus horneckiae TaxID=549687 RepID=UPI0019D246EB|nr:LysR family transcriptional regulator [Cytobacillus horneckiae]MBN6886388.1 LysR family transcriptional regulator [Cytobacillus horneckiae]
MDLQQLEYFRTLAQTQHVTRSAEVLSISQSALSRSIARLEDEMGVPLFDRQGRTIRLNQFGQIFLERVENMMKEFNEGKKEIQDLLEPESGTISLGFLHTLSTNLIPDLISSFRIDYPKIKFKLGQGPSHILLDQLQSGEIDLCLIAPNDVKHPVRWEELWSEELFVIVPKNHKFANYQSIKLEQLANEPFIHLKKGFSLRITVEQLFQEVEITPDITFEGEEADTVAALVAAGLGISILPDLKGIDKSKLLQIPLSWPLSQRRIGLAWVEGRYISPANDKFKSFVFEKYNQTK